MSQRTVVFDLDDTLIRHDRVGYSMRLAEYMGITYTNLFNKCFLESLAKMKRHLFDTIITREVLANYFEYMIPQLRGNGISGEKLVEAFENCPNYVRDENVDIMLEHLSKKNVRMYVLTDWFYVQQEKILREFGYFDYFEKIFTWDNYYAKPSKRSIQRCLLDEDPNDFVFVGDSIESDIACAKMVAMSSVWFNPDGIKNPYRIKPEYTISDMRQLISIV